MTPTTLIIKQTSLELWYTCQQILFVDMHFTVKMASRIIAFNGKINMPNCGMTTVTYSMETKYVPIKSLLS